MKSRKVCFSPEARADLRKLRSWIVDVGGSIIADRYLGRLKSFCAGLAIASERGTPRDHVRPGLRVLGFERRVTVAFAVQSESVTVLRVFYAGVDWEKRALSDKISDKIAEEARERGLADEEYEKLMSELS